MSAKNKLATLAVIPALTTMLNTAPVMAQGCDGLEQVAQHVEAAIQSAMSRAGHLGRPTLGQLGGVQGGSTGTDAGGSEHGTGAGNSSGSSSGGASGSHSGGSS